MAQDPYGLIASGLPPEIAAEAMGIKGRQAIAQALLQQSMQDLQAPEVKGRFSVPIHPLQGISKVAQAYLGQKGLTDADKAMAGLGEKYKQGKQAALAEAQKIGAGTPAVEPFTEAAAGKGALLPQPAIPGDKRKQIEFMLTNQYLQNDPRTAFEVARLGKAEDLTAASELRRAEGEERRASEHEFRKQMADQAEQLRRDLANANNKPIVVTDSAGNTKLVDNQGNLVKDLGKVGKPTATYEKAVAAKKKLKTDLDTAISELEKATADGGLIDKSTGSGIGAGVDRTAKQFGVATPGAIAAASLAPIYDLALKMVPRFEGPQSDKDTQAYKEAAGQLANPAVPNAQKKAAGKVILRLMKERRNQFISTDMEGMETEETDSGWKDL